MDNFDKYAEYTKIHNWEAICKLNNVKIDSFGTKKELKVLPDFLEPDEVYEQETIFHFFYKNS